MIGMSHSRSNRLSFDWIRIRSQVLVVELALLVVQMVLGDILVGVLVIVEIETSSPKTRLVS
jgi:hypothetical protein